MLVEISLIIVERKTYVYIWYDWRRRLLLRFLLFLWVHMRTRVSILRHNIGRNYQAFLRAFRWGFNLKVLIQLLLLLWLLRPWPCLAFISRIILCTVCLEQFLRKWPFHFVDFNFCGHIAVGKLAIAIMEALNSVSPKNGPLFRFSKQSNLDHLDMRLDIDVEEELDLVHKSRLGLPCVLVDQVWRCSANPFLCLKARELFLFNFTICVIIWVAILGQFHSGGHLVKTKSHGFSLICMRWFPDGVDWQDLK